jgi:hypothetical protein
MRRMTMLVGAVAALAAPTAAQAGDEPTTTDRQNAAQECRFERGTTDATREAFRVKYGTNKNGKNAFGKCVSRHARDEHSEGKAAKSNAAKLCDAERGTTAETQAAFSKKYGTGKNGKNAFGKCVSQRAKQNKAEADAADKQEQKAELNAAQQCRKERGTSDDSIKAFNEKYGTNKNKRNAFGKCVSQKSSGGAGQYLQAS